MEKGVAVERVATDEQGRIDLVAALQVLSKLGITRVFSEGGPRVAAALIARGLADEVFLLTSAKPLGREGVPALDAPSRARLADDTAYRLRNSGVFGADRYRQLERVR